jgi:PAS domain S-box-containing protein
VPANDPKLGNRENLIGAADPASRKDFRGLKKALSEPDTTALQALRDSEQSYRRLFESAQDGILILDGESGRIRDANPFLLQLLRYSFEEVLGKTVGELSPFKDVMPNRVMLQRLKEDGYVRYEDLPLETRDGRQIAVEFVSNVYEVGERTVIQCNIRDITERKRAEQRLSLLNTCVSNLNDVFMVTEAESILEPGPRIVFVNESFERTTGYSAAEMMGRSPRLLQGKDTDRAVLAEIHGALERHEPIRRQLLNYRKDGSSFWVDIDIVPIFDRAGKCTHFAAIERDITEARKNEARFRRLVDSNVQGVMFWNKKGEVSDANDAFLKMMMLSREDVVTGGVNWAKLTPPEFAHLDQNALKELSSRKTCEPYEKEFIRKDGTRIAVFIGAAVFEDNPNEGVCFVLDLTERKKLEKQFLRAQRMESIGTLAGGIAHDLNNILTPIMMSISLLQDRHPEPDVKKILGTIGMCAARGSDIVRQVLSFARGVDGERREIQPKHLLHELESIIKDTFPRDIRLKFSVPNDTWTILGDPTQVHQILLNLCVNARDAMPNGGSLSISAENCILDEHYVAMKVQLKAGRYLKICVTDSGSGIPKEIVDKIFDPFFTTKEFNRGTGLGLSTVMGIVNSHEGTINVYSEMSKGTTFTVYLPALKVGSAEPGKSESQPKLPRGNDELILVVDDEAAIRIITSQTLQAFGYRVLTAEDGADAIAIYAQNKTEIALVLTDMMMPVMGGAAEIHALRRINPSVKILTASGLNASGDATANPALGNRFLLKPYSAATLLQAVRATLDDNRDE